MSFELASGAEARWTNEPGRCAVVCVNGGTAAELPGTWSSSLEWLVLRLAARHPAFGFLEVRYRTKSWRRLELCIEDGHAAIGAARDAGAEEIALLGYSMGGAVAVHAAEDPAVRSVIALAPWLYPQLDLAPLAGRRLAIVHGSLDRGFPGIPGVRPALSLDGYTRARALGINAVRTVIPLASHAIALRGPAGRLVALPRARRWIELVTEELERFCA
ncbi:MAG: alpha/beta fold hydrolase [Actinobacteria bacterium]|nr:alpha/beta fold hydrolase [Actinomycetota bacterium]